MDQRTCADCGVSLVKKPGPGRWPKRCQACRTSGCTVSGCHGPIKSRGLCPMHWWRWKRHGDPGTAERIKAPRGQTPTCTEPGCDRPHDAKGLCKRHYHLAHPASPSEGKPCGWCGNSITSWGARFCSRRCSGLGAATKVCEIPWARCLRCSRWFVSHRRASFCSSLCRTTPPSPIRHPHCGWCGESFTTNQPAHRYCSKRCSKNAHERTRGRFRIPDHDRLAIYERDYWTCQLCHEPVDPTLGPKDRWGPTLDHIVPQSHQLIPDHRPQNLRLAHRLCNSLRGDGMGLDTPSALPAA